MKFWGIVNYPPVGTGGWLWGRGRWPRVADGLESGGKEAAFVVLGGGVGVEPEAGESGFNSMGTGVGFTGRLQALGRDSLMES